MVSKIVVHPRPHRGEQVVGIAFKKESVPENVDELFCAVCRERAPRTGMGNGKFCPLIGLPTIFG
jgi:hypothetical protein